MMNITRLPSANSRDGGKGAKSSYNLALDNDQEIVFKRTKENLS